MMNNIKTIRLSSLIFIIPLFLFAGCATTQPVHSPEPLSPVMAFVAEDTGSKISRFAPVFLVDESDKKYNLIGKPKARYDENGDELIFVDPQEHAVYWQEIDFTTEKATYTNLIYRVHFQKVPFSILPFHLISGNNVGLIVVVTLNDKHDPVLITTVNTCGCYCSIIPTSFLPEDSYPENWESGNQAVYGKTLPGLIDYGSQSVGLRSLLFSIGGETHRVQWIQHVVTQEELSKYETVTIPLIEMEKLDQLSISDGTTSFFETTGSRNGYVKGSSKIWERLLMSWWAFDWNIGVYKRYGQSKGMNTIFYTSLKIWARDDSDMWNFPRFLEYWGWKL